MRGRPAFLSLALAGLAASAAAQPAAAPPSAAPTSQSTAALRPPLFDGLGSYHRKITTGSAQAQRYFDQGLRLLYAFNHEEAERSFAAAAQLDPACAICFWGAALTLGPNINLPAMAERSRQAYEDLQKALTLAARPETAASPVEQALIGALAHRYSDPPAATPAAQQALDAAYADAMREAAKRFPADLDVATLFAESMMDLRPWDLWTADGRPQPGTAEILATLEGVLAKDPRHPGANHYYIHTVEGSPHPEKAVAAADRVGRMMPAAGHLVHMPAHIYERVGRYADAAAANRRAIAADRAYLDRTGPPILYSMYVAHNYQFLAATAMMEGRGAEAVQSARAMLEHAPLEMLRQMPGMDFVLQLPLFAMIRFGRWDDILAEPAPPADLLYPTAVWHYARGLALASRGKTGEAHDELAALDAIAAKVPADQPAGYNTAKALLAIASQSLGGVLAAKRGAADEAAGLLARAATGEDALKYDEPPDWPLPIRHQLGAVLLAAGRAAEAEAVYREDLKRNPRNGWSLYGLAQALRARRAEASAVEKDFRQAWKNADVRPTASVF
ncbi:MAG TPA: hypothetical protein VOA87_19280 [Thermoanaerobaculia bacterium]|nr:hypothetical protein [Thermoanaerobaculia bacterium]